MDKFSYSIWCLKENMTLQNALYLEDLSVDDRLSTYQRPSRAGVPPLRLQPHFTYIIKPYCQFAYNHIGKSPTPNDHTGILSTANTGIWTTSNNHTGILPTATLADSLHHMTIGTFCEEMCNCFLVCSVN